ICALLTREHVLVFGKFGTGKSRLVEFFFGAFTEANLFSIELTKFMTESNIVGMPNPKTLRDEGIIHHERAGTILDAHFAELDELFDANDYLLRTLLGVLNERRFHRGVQMEKAFLHTALASTNADPEVEMKRAPNLGAVVDRFLFQTGVKYLETDEGRRRMFTNYLANARPATKIPYANLNAFSDAVKGVSIQDAMLVELYNQILQAFQKGQKVQFSDRRTCQALKLAQANALMLGRNEVLPEDFMATMWVFCKGNDVAAQEAFKKVADPLIEKATGNRRQPDVVRTQLQLLDTFEQRTQFIPVTGASGLIVSTPEELVTMRRTLIVLESDLAGLTPANVAVADRQRALLTKVRAQNEAVRRSIDEGGASV
ncbi:MAG: AAA family ATPase, partial [Candidatus Uhrbacteria bacterium]|nr:AAA family ATPase [Candidatus Uhrbacteria bacterium]